MKLSPHESTVFADLATFHNPTIDEAITTLTDALQKEFSRPAIGLTVTSKSMRQQMRDTARQFNLSRPRGVSLKRPSPQLSRNKLATMQVIARMEILYREAGDC